MALNLGICLLNFGVVLFQVLNKLVTLHSKAISYTTSFILCSYIFYNMNYLNVTESFCFKFIMLPLLWINILITLYCFVNNKNFKLSRMNTSAVHACLVIICYLCNISGNILHHFSFAYYVMDTVYELINMYQNKKVSILDLGMILHHTLTMSTVSYLGNESYGDLVYKAYFLAELSNLPMYLAYHLKHIKYPNTFVIKSIVIAEILAYVVLRLILGTSITVTLMGYNTPVFITISSCSMLIISAVWTIKLVKQLL